MTAKYTLETTNYDVGDAEYDAVDWPYQLIANASEGNETLVALFADKDEAEHVMKLLEANPFDESAGQRVV
jgi:hypothetical protein